MFIITSSLSIPLRSFFSLDIPKSPWTFKKNSWIPVPLILYPWNSVDYSLHTFFEFSNIILESVEHVIVWKIVQVELLKNNEDEQVDHDVLLDDHEEDVEDKRKYSAAVYTRDAVSIFVHAVKHDHWPIFSRRKPQHHYKGVRKGREVHVVVNLFAWSYSSEEEDTEDWEDEVDEGE